MVDREAKRAEGKGVGYDRWAAKHNLKQMAATVTAYQQYGFSSPEELDEACSAAYAAMQESLAWLEAGGKDAEREKELQRQVLAYSKTRPVRDGLETAENAKAKAAYRQKHESDFIIADAAARYFRENGISSCRAINPCKQRLKALSKRKTAATTITGQNGRSTAACRLSRAISTRFYAGASRSAERSRAMNGNIPAWTTASTGQPAALCMSAATMTAGTACCWRTASLACVYRVSAIRCSAAGLPPLSCPLMKHWKPPSCAGEAGNAALSAGRSSSQNPTGEILPGLRRTHEADKRRQTEAETKGEMSRFRAFQTRINQGFWRVSKGA